MDSGKVFLWIFCEKWEYWLTSIFSYDQKWKLTFFNLLLKQNVTLDTWLAGRNVNSQFRQLAWLICLFSEKNIWISGSEDHITHIGPPEPLPFPPHLEFPRIQDGFSWLYDLNLLIIFYWEFSWILLFKTWNTIINLEEKILFILLIKRNISIILPFASRQNHCLY